MEVRKRFENDKLKKLQIFNGAQLKYIAFISYMFTFLRIICLLL